MMRCGLWLVAVVVCACSPGTGAVRAGEAPRWIPLVSVESLGTLGRARAPFELLLPPELWEPAGIAGQWSTPSPLAASDFPNDFEVSPALRTDEREFDYLSPEFVRVHNLAETPARVGSFFLRRKAVHVQLDPGEPAPRAQMAFPATLTEVRAGKPRVFTRETTGDGLSLRTGETLELRVDWPDAAALRFGTVVLTPFPTDSPARLVVQIGGEVVHEYEEPVGAGAEIVRHAIPVPSGTSGPQVLRVRAEGGDAVWAIFAPVAGPREIGTPSERPWPDTRPNIVVFLADTLRADVLTDYGSELELTPHIDAFADEAVVFEQTWSPASWTLPSQASLFTASFPYEHGARQPRSRLGDELETVAQRLQGAGYRTGGITDGRFLSRRFGMDRGFEWYREFKTRSVEKTGAALREFLDADDGRPFFLFVQTYRVHRPYEASASVRAAHGERLGIDGTWPGLSQELHDHVDEEFGHAALLSSPEDIFALLRGRWTDRMKWIAAALQRLYHGGVMDLDRSFGEWVAELETRGLGDNTVVVFTSDHGEAFGEHGGIFHRDGTWDEVSRIPLIVRVPGLDGRRDARPASLIDLARTLCAQVGVEPNRQWRGVDLFGDSQERALFYFDCARLEPSAAWIEGGFKVAYRLGEDGLPEQEPAFVYDLGRDPRELENLAGELPEFVESRLDERAAEMRALMRPLSEALEAGLDEETVRRLEAMGYTDAGD